MCPPVIVSLTADKYRRGQEEGQEEGQEVSVRERKACTPAIYPLVVLMPPIGFGKSLLSETPSSWTILDFASYSECLSSVP